ncbi:MAG: D-alanyl-D-alanine carboxypeptidase [Rhizobiales bacterium]|nr:D-alanyl-D-alanine carboxypeptidase [Hyphomicrobiales bacterium]
MRRLVAIFLLVAVAVLPQAGAVAQPAEKPATEAALIEAAGFAAADVGYLVVDLADGKVAAAVLRYSNNLSAELVGLAASSKLTGRKLSLLESAAALAAWWQLRVPDADWTGLFLENHSGLSSRSLATPRQFVVMLEEAAGPLGGADFHALLRPISWKGVKGSARVKTGTMSYIRGLAGYLDTASGRRLAFAIFFNDDDKRAALDARFDPQVREIDPASRPWRDRALKLEETLTSAWAGDN